MNKKVNRIMAVFLLFSMGFVIMNFFRENNPDYVKYTARVGTYVISVEADALVVRDENVLEKGITGVMESAVSEGERVGAHWRVGALITGDIDQSKVSELNALNHQIDSLTQTLSEAGILTIADDKVNSTLMLSLENLRHSAAKNDFEAALLQAENVRILTERKAGITSSSTAQVQLKEAMEKRDRISASLGGSHKEIYSPMAGLYSSKLDGFEDKLTFDAILTMTPENIDAWSDMDNEVVSGACKIINNYKWYIVLNLEEDECEGIEMGKSYTVNFKDLNEAELTGVVKYVSEPSEDNRRAVAIMFDEYIDDFTSIRKTTVEVCLQRYTGIYVPRNAVDVVDGVQGVWVQNEVSVDFRSIEEVYRSDDFVLVKENAEEQGNYKNIDLYDNIILNSDKMRSK